MYMYKNLINSLLTISNNIQFDDLNTGQECFYYWWWGDDLLRMPAKVGNKREDTIELDILGIKFSINKSLYGINCSCQNQ